MSLPSGPTGDDVGNEMVVPPDLGQVTSARRFVSGLCAERGIGADLCDTVVLLTSEMVTNAIIHGRSEARIRVIPTPPGLVRVEVADENSRHPVPAELDEDALDGRGLAIVEMLATRWGVRDDPYGKTVWFEVTAA